MKDILGGWLGTSINGRTSKLYRHHSFIPFKQGKYDLFNDNCEHFANAMVYEIYCSEQIADGDIIKIF